MTDVEMRFWDKVRIGDGCWEWTSSKNKKGYGQFWIGGKSRSAPRTAWRFLKGEELKGQCACHRCDNPSCVRPSHIFSGTFAENNADRDRKGRHRPNSVRGEENGQSKLTVAQVKKVRALRKRGIHLSRIATIARRISWRWIP